MSKELIGIGDDYVEEPAAEPAAHEHEFSALWYRFGPYGEQSVHAHPCAVEGCGVALVGEAPDCDTKAPHRAFQLPLDRDELLAWRQTR